MREDNNNNNNIFTDFIYFYFLFLLKHLSLERRSHYSNEFIRHGWLDDAAVVSDDVIEALYTDLLSELMEGDSQEFEDSERTEVYDEGAVGGAGLATLANVTTTSSPSSPTTPPSSQLRRRGAIDIGELVAAASTAARATAWFAPDASSALSALVAAASAIAGTEPAEGRARPRPSTNEASDAAASGESRQHASASSGTEAAIGASVVATGSAPPQICIICAKEMRTAGMTNVCSHRDCCRRCPWRILREGDRRCPLCRRQYQRVW